MKSTGAMRLSFAFAAGAATVFGFAPFALAPLPILTLAVLILLWQGATSARAAAAIGYAFGAGLFGAGSSWVFVALNTYGGMPMPIAAVATAGFCGFLALYPAAVGWIAVKGTAPGSGARAFAAAAAWPLAEWARSIVFTGFPWLSLGYASLTGDAANPLAGYGPVGGVFMITLATALVAAALALALDTAAGWTRSRAAVALGTVTIVVAGGAALGRIAWTSPVGTPVATSLIQGNVTQDLKFDPDFRRATFDLYSKLVRESRGRLVVLPESAFPVFADEVPESVLLKLLDTMAARDGDALVGMFTLEPALIPGGGPRYYNSVVSIGLERPQLYRKRHLVPFGETIPLEPVVGWFIRRILSIPLASQASGDPDQPVLDVAGQRVALSICYEDAFGADMRRSAGDGNASRQRHQRCLVRTLDRRLPAQPDRGDARARNRAPARARDEYRHHVGNRPRWP